MLSKEEIKAKMHQDLLKDQQTMMKEEIHSKHFDMMWGKWLRRGDNSENSDGEGRTVWD